MALLQIAEPGQARPPHQHRLAVGIDLGTTNSLVATVRNGIVEPLADESGNTILPSVVRYFANGSTDTGQTAKSTAVDDPENTVISVKRFMGRSLQDIQRDNPRLPYRFADSLEGSPVPRLALANHMLTAVEVSSEILKTLRRRAEQALGGELTGAVITVPAHFDDAQRQATKDAARLAGIQVLRLLNEPTAAAVAYGLDRADQTAVAVYDLGGGTFDISILSLEQGVFQVLSTGGDTSLGGDDFDALIVDWIMQQAGLDTGAILDNFLTRKLLDTAILAKESLTAQDEVAINADLGKAGQWQGLLSRTAFEAMIEPLVKRTLQACRMALQDAGLATGDIQEVVMVGGVTRIPYIQEHVGRFFGRQVLTDIDPDRVVAMGAAIQADILAGNKPDADMLLLDVTPLSLGIETMGGLTEKVIPRNSALPVARAQEFTTFKDGQSAMSIHVVQGERELVSDCRSLAKFELQGIPPMPAGVARIRVTFQVDADGLLSVTAQEQTTGQEAGIQVKPSFGLSDDEITAMLRDSMTFAGDDVRKRRLAEQQVAARRVLESLDAAMQKDADSFLTEDEQLAIRRVRDALDQAQQGDDELRVKTLIEELEAVTASYVAQRMDSSVRRLMAGHSIDEFSRE